MSLDALKNRLPDHAKDIKLNLSSLARETVLDDQKKYGVFLASAYAVGERETLNDIVSEVEDKLSAEALSAAKAAASIMGMNNVFYRFNHLVSASDYKTMPAKLRMNVIGNPGVDKADFELWSLAVSAINGCGMCIDAHEHELRKAGLTTEQIQAAVRIASVVNAAAAVIRAEAALG
ncbi:MAG: alkyl hydroperoxide reductase [Oceanicaulis sp.]|jgi:alkyl hydroperoxide reductase subunit D|uniref:carboxymuconolactone decarboxylase family protein n=1 Tax=Oceanicaulis sp. UBA6590 TaxID=1947008 RepID=UPI000C407B8F|nr:carboxymuconolactone decarboxylase family protein [Oceanicaulis sp. UBA6590]MAB69136.1 alkyl hydroperoxide reductase [Oceanicaulis sp.]MBG36239.1 alkyl hydroperoxide reductase [Oceanicaulis sp.]HBU63674.1 alkyl hydroperoxide reductase [Oceanicaulis sp.]HCR95905.1 alkyl hydroperoxide reductase [Oceanicaulis sp.]